MNTHVIAEAAQALQHARNAYDKLKREQEPETAREMAALWVADVERRQDDVGAA